MTLLLFVFILSAPYKSSAEIEIIEHSGTCDASATITVRNDMFLMASNENNILRLCRRSESGKSLQSFNLNRFLKTPKHREADTGATAQIGDITCRITSHGTNRKGKTFQDKIEIIPVGATQKTCGKS